ncbi:MAG: hypothetical protein M1814_006416 [Vezdaea aestivalis]|nr:MAG: hypothetical protein M1814_006416 [Vezdaea aestivalis]
MDHQYPGAISGDENMLAELMIPDGAHTRQQDWTVFFLHKDNSENDGIGADSASKEKRSRNPGENNGKGDDSPEDSEQYSESEDTDDDQPEGPPLIYVLNLVNTKHDQTAKRGAMVKAMAICTRHSFLHIYKPLLLLALEDYFKSPVPETLESLYNAVNSMDLSLMPKLSGLERNILQSTDTKAMFVEKFEQMIQQRMEEDSMQPGPDSPSKSAVSLPRLGNGAHPHSTLPFVVPRDTHEYETKVVYHGVPVPIKVPTAISPEIVGDFSLIKLIQTFAGPHATSPQPFASHPHLTTGGPYTHPITVLVNAILTQKRIIFLGHQRPSGDVAEAVLASCALASGGILRGFTRHAFPYTDLTKIDELLKVPGFIAGVTNPAFAHHPEWWDLLCDLPTGRMKISNRIEQAPITEGLKYFQQQNPQYGASSSFPAASSDPTGDQVFMDNVLQSVANRHGEAVIRAKWRDWVLKFTRISAAFEESVFGASALYADDKGEEVDEHSPTAGHGYVWPDEGSKARELAGGVHRIEGWRCTRSYYSFIQDLANQYSTRPLKFLDLHHQHDRLRTQKLAPAAAGLIYNLLALHVKTPAQITQLLTVTPESHAGLFYISLGLFNPDKAVRSRTTDLLERIREHEAGRHFWLTLNHMAKFAMKRTRRREEALEQEIQSLESKVSVAFGRMS